MNTYNNCPFCGKPIQPGTIQCPHCNANLATPPTWGSTANRAADAPGSGYSAPNAGYSAPGGGYANPNPGYANPNPGYANPNPGYANPNPGYANPDPGYANPNPGYTPNPTYTPYPITREAAPTPPTVKLHTNFKLWKYILLGIVTCGIYAIIVDCKMVRDLNILASRYDGRKTMNPIPAYLLGILTAGVFLLVWNHKYANRIGNELSRRGINYSFSAKHFWLWEFLGSLIIVGPFIFKHKQMFATNKLCADYNQKG